MTTYHFQAYNAEGRTVTGTLQADSVVSLEERVRGLGLWLLEFRTTNQSVAVDAGKVNLITVGRGDLIHFFVQMSLLLKAGITLPNALERLALDNKERKLGVIVAGLHEQVTLGVPLHQAMARYPRAFGRQISAMIEAGEVSGKLSDVFSSLASYYEWTDQLSADIRQALIYPLMVMTAALGLIILLFTFVVPRFVGLLTDLNLEVPLLTEVVMSLSRLLMATWPFLLGSAILAPFAMRVLLRNRDLAIRWARLMMGLPVFGELYAMFGYSRFAGNMAMLAQSGIPILRSLEICEHLVGNRALEHALSDARRLVTEGTPLHKALEEQKVFSPTLVTMIATGESSGNVDFALRSVADYYNKLIPRRIKVVFSIFDPVMMISLIAIVGTVALSVILPILQLWNVK
ncbi:MAG: type II secretion system F family protein [Opitutaceae bacterium]|nr:type II secretion system F family protein [Opitutaceae bacterium]